jgi:hypothetical protein
VNLASRGEIWPLGGMFTPSFWNWIQLFRNSTTGNSYKRPMFPDSSRWARTWTLPDLRSSSWGPAAPPTSSTSSTSSGRGCTTGSGIDFMKLQFGLKHCGQFFS